MKLKTSANFAKPIRQLSLAELYKELDGIHWGWKLGASCANWIMLAGFVVLPSAFDGNDSKFRMDSTVLRACAVALLLVGYLATGFLCYYFKNILFQVEAIFVPGFTGSALGMLSSLFSVYGKKYEPGEQQWSGTAISAVTLSGVFMLFYGMTVLASQRRIDVIRQRDRSLDILHEELENPELIPEEEHTRRQFLRLLTNQPQPQPMVMGIGVESSVEISRGAGKEVRRSANVGDQRRSGEEEAGGGGGGLGLPPGLRLDQEFMRSGIIMKATLGHDEEISGDYNHNYGPRRVSGIPRAIL